MAMIITSRVLSREMWYDVITVMCVVSLSISLRPTKVQLSANKLTFAATTTTATTAASAAQVDEFFWLFHPF